MLFRQIFYRQERVFAGPRESLFGRLEGQPGAFRREAPEATIET